MNGQHSGRGRSLLNEFTVFADFFYYGKITLYKINKLMYTDVAVGWQADIIRTCFLSLPRILRPLFYAYNPKLAKWKICDFFLTVSCRQTFLLWKTHFINF